MDYSVWHRESWLKNSQHLQSTRFHTDVDVISIDIGAKTCSIQTNGIPSYASIMTETMIQILQARPKASTEFLSGFVNLTVGSTYEFGADIGYQSKVCNLGYWPPGPSCATVNPRTISFTLAPQPDTIQKSSVGLGPIGLFVNGVSIYGFSDAMTYKNLATWDNIATEMEQYDMDICNGHADPAGNYHHHHFPRCLSSILESNNSDRALHSPIYGWLQDGFPLYGPHHGNQTFARSCWLRRNYSSAKTGCPDGLRSCILNNNADVTAGVYSLPSVLFGPPLQGLIQSQSGNAISTASGLYYQDYYFSPECFAEGGPHLDYHNGHSHDDLGYHYHITVDEAMSPIFPYIVGPRLYGVASSPYSTFIRIATVACALLAFCLVMFAASVLCDEYLVPSVEIFIVQFRVPEELAAVTFVALGNAAPELLIDTIGAIRSKASISLPTTLGSAMIAFGLIPPLCVFFSARPLFILSAVPILREVVFYTAGLSIFLYSIYDGYIQLNEALVLASVYFIYVSSVVFFYYYYTYAANGATLLPQDEEEGDCDISDEVFHEPMESTSIETEPSTTLATVASTAWRLFTAPVLFIIHTLMPRLKDPEAPSKVRISIWRAVAVLAISIFLVGNLSNFIISICGVIIEQLNVDPATLGATLVALGAEIPDTFSSIALAKKGYTDGAMAGAIGSQVINISIGVGLPSLLVCLFGKGVVVIHDSVDSIWLLTALLFFIICVYMLVALPIYRLVTCTLLSASAEALYGTKNDPLVGIRTHITKRGAVVLLLVYVSVYCYFFFENEDGDR